MTYSFSNSFEGYDPDNYVSHEAPWLGDAESDWYDEMYGPGPTSLSDAHSHWHAVNGWDSVCDLDCGAGEVYEEDFDDDAAEAWQMYGEPEARDTMSAQEYNLFEFGPEPPF